MTNAVDVLCVGGPKHETVVCFNRVGGLKSTHTFPDISGIGDDAVYTRREWWSEGTEHWYHIATDANDEPTDSEIAIAIAANLFPPAWDLRHKPAPEPEDV